MIKCPWNKDHRLFPILMSIFLTPFVTHATDHTIDSVLFEKLLNYILQWCSVLVFPQAYFIISFCCTIHHDWGGGGKS